MFKAPVFESILPAFILTIFISTATLAQSAAQIVEDSVLALGSKKDVAKVRNIHALADCLGPNGPYTTEIFSAKNSRLLFKQVRAGNVYKGITTGNMSWSVNEKTGDPKLAAAGEVFAWRSHDYQAMALNPTAYFKDPAYEGEEAFAGKQAMKLKAVDELGNNAYLFFDKADNVLLGFTIQSPFNPQETIRTVFSEWTKVQGIRLPSKATATDNKGDFVLNFKQITLNKKDESALQPTPKVTALVELTALHNEARAAHFNRDPALLVSSFADEYTQIGAGKIQRPAQEASIARFTAYFNNSRFLEWDDITPPVFRISDDATMAYSVVHKKVRLIAKDASGAEKESTEVFAWLATYKKIEGKWRLMAIASTNE